MKIRDSIFESNGSQQPDRWNPTNSLGSQHSGEMEENGIDPIWPMAAA